MTYWNKSKSYGIKRKYVYHGNSKKISINMDIHLFERLVNYIDVGIDGPNLKNINHAVNTAVELYVNKLDRAV